MRSHTLARMVDVSDVVIVEGDAAAVADTLSAAHDDDNGDFVEYGDFPAIAVVIGGDRFAL